MLLSTVYCHMHDAKNEQLYNITGYGLEVPCVYCLYGPKPYTNKAQEAVASIRMKGLL